MNWDAKVEVELSRIGSNPADRVLMTTLEFVVLLPAHGVLFLSRLVCGRVRRFYFIFAPGITRQLQLWPSMIS